MSKKVFALKQEISVLQRSLWTQNELMLTIEEGVIPTIQSSEVDKETLRHAIGNVSQQFSHLSSNDNSLDSILSLQDLGMIHRVERILVILAIITLVTDGILLLKEFGIFGI